MELVAPNESPWNQASSVFSKMADLYNDVPGKSYAAARSNHPRPNFMLAYSPTVAKM